jgi:hypothetical protein
MKLVNNNISPLPFYDNLVLQNHRKDYAFGQVYPLITYKNMLLPFQVVLANGTSIECSMHSLMPLTVKLSKALHSILRAGISYI